MLAVTDAIDWLRGVGDRFDPRGLIGLLGFHFFFLAPLLHVRWGYFMPEVTGPPPDWRDWLGSMALLNALGLLIYRVCSGGRVTPAEESGSAAPAEWTWALNGRRFFALLAVALPLTAALQISVYASYGGVLNYIEAATDRTYGRNTMQGMGVLFMFSESFPMLMMMGFVVWVRCRPQWQSWTLLLPALACFLVLALFFGGLRANRSNTVWNLFWAVGLVHFWVRPIPMRLIVLGLLFLTVFMYAYGLFKGAGLDAVEALESKEAHEALVAKTRRPMESVVLDDFGRSDVQAFLLYRITAPDSDYEYGLGRTYAIATAILVPRALWPDRPPNMAKEGTEAQFGMGMFAPDVAESSRVYGLAGEAMLNFGPLAVPLAFLLWGLTVGFIRRRPAAWAPGDARLLLYPLAVVVAFAAVFQDVENQIFFIMKFGTVPFLVTWLASSVQPALAAGGSE